MIELDRHDFNLGYRRKMPVNEAILQEIVDVLFMRGRRFQQDPDWAERKTREWEGKLFALPASQVIATIAPQTASGTPNVVPSMKWPQFLAISRKAGRTAQEAAADWKDRKAAMG